MDTSAQRRTRAAITLALATLLLIGMFVVGVKAATKPLPTFETGPSNETCSESEIVRKFRIARNEITVSVFNAGARKGFAGKTQERLEYAGFRVGELGNAPAGMRFKNSVVFTHRTELAPARLVAKTLGHGAEVRQTDEEYGPGVDVFVGSEQRRLNKSAPKRIKLDTPEETCIRVE